MRTPSPTKPTKVRAGFYRAGAYCIHKGDRWCIFERDIYVARFRTLEEAFWWTQKQSADVSHQENRGRHDSPRPPFRH